MGKKERDIERGGEERAAKIPTERTEKKAYQMNKIEHITAAFATLCNDPILVYEHGDIS